MKIYLSIKGKKTLEKKLETIEKEIAETYRLMGESTKVDNDLRENPEYLELQTRVTYKLPYEKNEIKEKLANSLILEEQEFYKSFNNNEVIIGTKVKLTYDGVEEEYSIVGYGEEDPFNNIISYTCDLAINLIGKKLNDEFKYRGAIIKIIAIELV